MSVELDLPRSDCNKYTIKLVDLILEIDPKDQVVVVRRKNGSVVTICSDGEINILGKLVVN